jgi:cation diffusion facilitator family transporter
MHMGHSHSSNIHDHSDSETPVKVRKDPAVIQRQRRRRAAMVIFCALCTLGPSLARFQALRKFDLIAFGVTCTLLASFDKLKREVSSITTKLSLWRDGFVRHSPKPEPGAGKFKFFQTENAADRVTLVGVVINLVLSCGKFVIGVHSQSNALIADAGHSLSDLFSDFVTLYSVQIARLPPDEDHPYGHGKFEAIGSLFLSLILLATGVSVGAMANKDLWQLWQLHNTAAATTAGSAAGIAAVTVASQRLVQLPKAPALVMAFISIVSKEWLYRITKKVGDDLNSQVVIANAWHHRSDAYSSVLALFSIALAMTGLVAADSAAGLLVAGMICMTGVEILSESIKQLSDTTNQALVDRVDATLQQHIAESDGDVIDVNRVRARQVGSSALVDVQISTAAGLSVSAARTVEERTRQRILRIPGILDAEVHAQPQNSAVVCPILLEQEAPIPSASEVEYNVRQSALLLQPNIDSVTGVTVHYEDTVRVCVDVDIRVASDESSLSMARQYAAALKQSLQGEMSIYKARIYLDLNNGIDMDNNSSANSTNSTLSSSVAP